ncbi:uncharacterized protein N0V89_011246 [Didymosphaeria variabile]|uniref:Ankyrin n=1 Tax=Didymosphaeria variabile TaxID=1932322 RepID=A0A9W8XCR0_9PLEO|nr:uncharacterized protein N0V89_011246 [Didymosphaeria variabile]KAJ4347306.1 hypothetical protein N0V89_011246 [Didymosphaeria variabile]
MGLEFKDGKEGKTPLILAVEWGEEAVVKLQLNAGAKLESKDKHGQTALSWAAKKEHQGLVQLLFDMGAHPPRDDVVTEVMALIEFYRNERKSRMSSV